MTSVPFIYDADDYEYLPGLKQPWDADFLTSGVLRQKGPAQIRRVA